MFHRRLQEIHSGKPCNSFFRSKEHDHSCTAADHDRIYKNPQCLYQSRLDRLVTFCCCRCTRCRPGTRLIGKQASLDPIHQYCTKTACCRLSKTEGFFEYPCKHTGKTSYVHHNDQDRDRKIAYRHHRNDHIQDLDCCIFAKHDHCRNCHKHNCRINRRNRKCIFERRNNRIADHLTDTAPADQT